MYSFKNSKFIDNEFVTLGNSIIIIIIIIM
jgi:hypothetical protein